VSPRGNIAGADPGSFTTSYTRDLDGRVTSATTPAGSVTSYVYDGNGNVTSVTNPRGKTTRYSYDGDNEQTAVTRPDGTTLATGYDADGNVTSQTSAAGHVTTYGYDALDELTSMATPPTGASPSGIITGYGYDPAGYLTTLTQPGAGGTTLTTTDGYDPAGQLTSTTYSDGSTPAVTYTYDADGRRTSMTDGTGTTHYTYNASGWLTSLINGAGQETAYTYDLDGNPTTITYPNGKTVTRGYDPDDQLTSTSDWNNNTTTFAYDPDGNLVKTAYPNGVTENGTFRPDDSMSELADTDGSSTLADYAYTRDPNTAITQATATGSTAGPNESYGYNDLDQLSQYTTSAAGVSSGTLTYDADGNLTGLPGGTTLSYDAADELTATSAPGMVSNTYGYDARGDRTSVTPSFGLNQSMAYNQAGELTGFTWGTNTTHYAYDGDGLRTAKTVGTTTSQFAYDPVTGSVPLVLSDGANNYLYGPNDTPIEQIANTTPISLVTTATATDSLGLDSSLSVTFPTPPQAGDQILLAVNESAGQDAATPAGYTVVGTFAAPSAGETTVVFRRTATGTETGATVAFNEGLNIHAKTLTAVIYRGVDPTNPIEATTQAGTTYGSTSVTTPSLTTAAAGDELVLIEDALNTLPGTTWTPPTGMATRATASALLVSSAIADQPLPTPGPTGTRTAKTSLLGQLEAVAIALRPAPAITYLQHDQLGSTRLLTSTTGAVVGTYSYSPYGATLSHAGSASTPLEFNGQYQDAESDLYYLRARYYDPTTGSFLTRDPLAALTQQPFEYANDDPINSGDPSGMSVSPGAKPGCVAGGAVAGYPACPSRPSFSNDIVSFYKCHWRGTLKIAGASLFVLAAATGVGALVDATILGVGGTTLAGISGGAGIAGGITDLPGCIAGKGFNGSCVGATVGTAGGIGGLIAPWIDAANAIFGLGLGGYVWDAGGGDEAFGGQS
jgi:RHS repeat-associated protein